MIVVIAHSGKARLDGSALDSSRIAATSVTKHEIYNEHEGFRLWNYITCKKDDEGQEVWRINIEVKRVDEVVISVVAGDQTFP
ncbi:hypothetical protein [Pseudomonas frederiksbergensis]|uniref:hypothetical protein n=1 Tax=Pseudomonas frederiksbergensis TaxID=104087 RepID=UPI003D25CF24